MKKFYLVSRVAFLVFSTILLGGQKSASQNVPELMYYKFDAVGGTVANMASAPVGTNPSSITGLTIGGTGQFGTGLVGTGLASSTNNVNTGWTTNLTGSWTISMWLNIPSSTSTRYFFGDLNSGSFRCFSGGVATDNGLRLTGSFTFDILNIGIASGPFVVHYVYDALTGTLSGYINGVLKNSGSFPGLTITGAGPFYVGGYSTTNGSVDGTLDEFRMYNRALDVSEISSTWNITLPGGPCTNPPVPGTATASPNSAICIGTPVLLNLSGNSFGTGQTYVWQSSSTSGGPYADISISSSNSSYTVNPTTTTWYRCAVSCGGNTQNSVPVEVFVNPAFPGGTYTINSGVATGGNNFQTFTDAVAAISCGISGPVVFNVAIGSGPYNEKISIPQIGGASAINTITFNGNNATIQATPVTADRHIIRLNGADHIILKKLSLLAESGSGFGWGVHLTNGANNNTIDSCTIDMSAVTSTTQSNSAGIVASGSTTVVTTAGNASNNTISNNTIIGAYQGIIITGTATGLNAVDNVITKNTIQDFYANGIIMTNNDGAEVSYNNISRANRTAVTTFAGIELGTGNRNCTVNANRIHDTHNAATTQTGTAYGVYATACDAPVGSENKVTNNLIYNFNSESGTIYALYNSSSDNIHYYHNTIVLDHASATAGITRGFFQTTLATGIDFRNNIIYISRAGTGLKYCVYVGTTTSTIISNNNVLYNSAAAGTNGIGFYSIGYTTLADWKTANGNAYDQSSISEDPLFVNPGTGDFTPAAVPLNNIGANVGITTDILNNPRIVVSPDPGAYEFSIGGCVNPPTPGGAISSTSNICQNVDFTLNLAGNSVGDGQTYQWQSSPDDNTWTNISSPASASTFTTSQTTNTYYRCAVKCGAGTTLFSASVFVTSPPLVSGTFTINSGIATGAGNFQTFAEAVNSLACGIGGPVVFNVAIGSGPYNEQIVIPSINGTSAVNTITFNGNNATVQATPVTADRHIIRLDGTDYITLKELTLLAQGGSTFGWGVHLTNGANNNTIDSCTIDMSAVTSTTQSNSAGIVASGSTTSVTIAGSASNNTISNNTIIGAYQGIIITGTATGLNAVDNVITTNTIQDFYANGITLTNNDGAEVSYNNISRANRTAVTTFAGIELGTGNRNSLVNANRIHDTHNAATTQTGTAYGVFATSCDAPAGSENKVTNNLIYNFNSGSGTIYALYNSGSDSIHYYHNTIVLDHASATAGVTRGFFQTTLATGIDFRNNIIYITRGGTGAKHCVYFGTTTSTIISNNNVLYNSAAAGTNEIGFYSVGFATLADWKTANSNAYDQSSISVDPIFTNPGTGDFTPSTSIVNNIGAAVGVLADINDLSRSVTAPDPGAYEFSTLTAGINMGAEALVAPSVAGSGCYSNAETVSIRIRNNSLSTIDFAVNPVTITVNVTGATTATLNALLNSGTLATDATIIVPMSTTLDMTSTGVYTFDAFTSVTGDVNPTNDVMLTAVRTKAILSAGTISASPGAFCVTPGAPVLSTSAATGYTSLQWQESTTSGAGFTNIPNATTSPFTVVTPISQTMYYRLVAGCGINSVTSTEIAVIFSNPQVLTTTPAARCGTGTVGLGASVSSGAIATWYDVLTGGTAIGTGTTFTTPSISSNTTYYVSAGSGASTANTGLSAALQTATSGAGTTNFGLVFDALASFTLQSVIVYPISGSAGTAGTVTIDVVDGTGAVLHTATVNVIGNPVASVTGQIVNLNFNIQPGTNYKLRPGSRSTGITGLLFEPSASAPAGNYGYPFVVPGILSINTSTLTAAPTNTVRNDLYYYFYNWVVSTGCESARTAVLATVETPPSATISYAGSPFCNGTGTTSVTQTGTTGGTYSSTAGLSINSTTGAIDLSGSSSGTYTVTYRVAASSACPQYETTTSVILGSSPVATISYTGTPYCSNAGTATVTQTGSTGGTYSSTAGLSINAVTGAVNIGASTAGTYTVTYSIAASGACPAFQTTTSITINTAPVATIAYTSSPYCNGAGTATVTQTGTIGGTYSSTAGLSINASTGEVTLGTSLPATYTVTYTVAASNGCALYQTTASITITTNPSATISYAGSPYCSNGGTANVSRSGSAGGTYSSTAGLTINASTGAVTLGTSTPGTYTVTYTVAAANGCSQFQTTTNITITAAPAATISYAGSPYCSNSGTATVTQTGSSGGTYSSTAGLTINASTGAITLGTSTAGTYTVTYTVAAANGCAQFQTTGSITITAAPVATISYAGSPYCSNSGTATVTQTGTTGGTYTSTAGLSINAATGAVTLGTSTAGLYTVTYTVAAANGCAQLQTTGSIRITAAPAATISYAGSPYCSNSGTATVTQTGTTGGTYTSTAGLTINASTGAVTTGTSTAGTYTVTYTVAAANGCSQLQTTASITITAAPSATISYAGSPFCISGTVAVTQTGTTGGVYTSTAGLSINASTGAINLATSAAGAYTITYTVAAANGCAQLQATTNITISANGSWLGTVSNNWNTAGNWCGGVPTSTTDVTIPASAPNMPNLSAANGAVRNISIANGATLTIGAGGILDLYGNITGAGTFNATAGSISFRSATGQIVPGFTATNVTMNGTGGVTPAGNTTVTGTLTLTNGNITLGSNTITLNSSSTGSTASHIITNGAGNVVVANLAASQTRTIPIGVDATSYNPATLATNAAHATDNFTVRVQQGVFVNGISGATFTTHVADRMWIINEAAQGGSNVNVTLQWIGSQELTSFNRTKSYVMQHNGTTWSQGTPTAATGADPYTQTKQNLTTFSPFAVETQRIPRPVTGIYPNPTSDFLNVVTDLLSSGPVVFKVYDAKGREVYRRQETLSVGLSQTTLNLTGLSAGVYVVRVSTRLNENFIAERFIKVN